MAEDQMSTLILDGRIALAEASPDSTPPQLTSAVLSAPSVDLNDPAGPQLSLSLGVSDDLSGWSIASIYFRSSSGKKAWNFYFDSTNLSSGSIQSGIVTSNINLGALTENGPWKIDSVFIADKNGNSRSVTSDFDQLLVGLGSLSFDVFGASPDSTPPQLTSAVLSAPSVDLNDPAGPQLSLSLGVSDDLSGWSIASIYFRSSSGKKAWNFYFDSTNLSSGSIQSGIVTSNINLGALTENGPWKIDSVFIADKNGNSRSVTSDFDQLLVGLGSLSFDVFGAINDGAASFAISGTPAVGNTLTAATSSADPDGNGTFSYSWQSSSDGSTWSPVGTNSSSYLVASADQGKQLRLVASYTDGQGFSEAVTTSAGSVPLANDGAASFSISGTPAVGNTLTAITGSADPDGNGAITYSWQISSSGTSWSPVGSNQANYQVTAADAGKQLRLAVSYIDGEGFIESVITSAGFIPNPRPLSFSVSGENGGGGQISSWKGQFIVNDIYGDIGNKNTISDIFIEGTSIGPITFVGPSSSYMRYDGLYGGVYRFYVSSYAYQAAETWNNLEGNSFLLSSEIVNSRGTYAQVPGFPLFNANGGTIAFGYIDHGQGIASPITSSQPGIFNEGVTLSAGDVAGDPDGDVSGGMYEYQWYRNGLLIVGATLAAYKTTGIDAGEYKVAITYSDAQNFIATVDSPFITLSEFNNGAATFSISGTPAVGNTLTAITSTADPDGNGTFSYSWQTSTDGSSWSPVGTNSSNYLIASADQGKQLRLVVSYTDGQGFSESVTTAGGSVPLVNDGAASFSISGTPAVGNTLTATNSTADPDGNGTFSYSWQSSADGSSWNPVGTNSPSYLIASADQGKQLRLVVSYTDGQGFSESVTTAGGSVPLINDGAATFSISGTPAVGNTLTATTSSADPDGNGAFTYSWQSSTNGTSWSPVGTNSPSYLVASADQGKQLRLVVSYTDGQGFPESVTTAAGTVGTINDGADTFSISGTPAVGNTLTATTSSPDPDGNGTFSYSWQTSTDGSSWSPVGTNSPSYLIASADQGKQLRLVVSYTDGQGFSESVTTAGGSVPSLPLSPPPSIGFSASPPNQAEGNIGSTPYSYSITRSGDLSQASSVFWEALGSGANPATAMDFTGGILPTGILTFQPGQDTLPVVVNVVGDTTLEANEGFEIVLSAPTNAVLASGSSTAFSVIINDDQPGATYSFTATPDPVYEGNLLAIGVSTTNVAPGTQVFWQFSGGGITATDFSDGLLTGNTFFGMDGRASFTKRIAADADVDPDEILELRFFSDSSYSQQLGSPTTITIKETNVGLATDGNDLLTGTSSAESISGVPVGSTLRGRGSLDQLTGSGNVDTFVLGDALGIYYDDGTPGLGTSDLAVITDFTPGDRIQLSGSNSDYRLVSGRYSRVQGLRIDALNGSPGGGPEAIGFVQGATLFTLNLTDPSQFLYV